MVKYLSWSSFIIENNRLVDQGTKKFIQSIESHSIKLCDFFSVKSYLCWKQATPCEMSFRWHWLNIKKGTLIWWSLNTIFIDYWKEYNWIFKYIALIRNLQNNSKCLLFEIVFIIAHQCLLLKKLLLFNC